jgi:hypothetical protein
MKSGVFFYVRTQFLNIFIWASKTVFKFSPYLTSGRSIFSTFERLSFTFTRTTFITENYVFPR